MARIFITGSADGLGFLAAKALLALGHQVVLHARNEERRKQVLAKVPGAEEVLAADLSSMEETRALASEVNALGQFDAVIYNAGVYQASGKGAGTKGWPEVFVVNSLAPYILTSLVHKPKRLIYLSSGMHVQGSPGLDNLQVGTNRNISYADTKLHDLILSMAVARKWTDVYANAVNPGWVPTKMGGAGAPDDLEKGFQTQVWLAASNDPGASVSGCYFHHKKQAHYLEAAGDSGVQDKFLDVCEQITGVAFD